MGLHKIDRPPRVLLVIAPTLFECFHAMKTHGLEPKQCENFRNITKAHHLRGAVPGTPYILANRGSWPATRDGFDLDAAVTAYQLRGCLRPARSDDLDNCRVFPLAKAARQ